MRTINLLAFLIVFFIIDGQAQPSTESSDQQRTIEINNDEGRLSLTFENGTVTKFIINGEHVAKNKYDDYQKILDEFTKEDKEVSTHKIPSHSNANKGNMLREKIVEYLLTEHMIDTANKYKIKLRRKYMKVNGEKMPKLIHNNCLHIFDEIYGHRLNFESKVKFNKSKNNSESSISIID